MGVNGGEWIKVVYGIVISVVVGLGLGWLVCKAVELLFRRADRRKTEPFFKGAQIVGAAFMAFMHGAQDGQKIYGRYHSQHLFDQGYRPKTDEWD